MYLVRSSKMYKLIILIILLKIIAVSSGRSFTVVLDTTVSMDDEINIIKASVGQIVNSINRTDIDNYILVPFKDILAESPFIADSQRDFSNHLNTITTSGGSDCPENSLAAVESALRASKPESYIFVFTDAYAKDYDRIRAIETLCGESHSQVMVFLSGFCLPTSTSAVGTVDVYYEVAKACSGAFFRFDTTYDLRQAFNFMKEIMNTEWTDVTPQETVTNHKVITFSVDAFTTDFMIGVSGSNPVVTILETSSQHPRTLDRVLFTRHALVVHLKQPVPGQYSVGIRGQGKVFVTFYERNYIPFQYGFSTKLPRNLLETSLRPLAGWSNYVMISINTAVKLESIEWLSAGESTKNILFLDEKYPGLYVTNQQLFVEPGKTFRFWIIGKDADTLQHLRGSTKYIFPQIQVSNVSWIKPQTEILDTESLVDYGTELTLVCKVTGFPKPNIRWEVEEEVLPSEEVLLEIPLVHLSYVKLPNVTTNSTIYCKSENTVGEDSHSIGIFVNRTHSFDVVETPEDTSVNYGEDLILSCQVNAYPEAKIEWHFNGTLVDSYSNSKVVIQQHTLTVRNVILEDGGVYECLASNEVESRTYSAKVTISGLETPEVEITNTEIISKPGDIVDIDCRVTKGTPVPEVKWQYKQHGSYEYEDMALAGVSIEEEKLKISSVEKQHGGVYRCSASNVVGSDYKDITVKIQYAPIINNNEIETATVKEEESIQLVCEVDAIPEATVHWEMNQDDVIVPLGERHTTDEYNTLQFTAYWNDSGNYHCIAQNDIGRAERTVTVNVLVSPFIETPKAERVYSKVGGHVDFSCNVLFGSPTPDIQWKFIAPDSTSSIINRNNSTLHLRNVTQSDEGSYMCIAENHIGIDSIKYTLKVQ